MLLNIYMKLLGEVLEILGQGVIDMLLPPLSLLSLFYGAASPLAE